MDETTAGMMQGGGHPKMKPTPMVERSTVGAKDNGPGTRANPLAGEHR